MKPYNILGIGEIMLRLTPKNKEALDYSTSFDLTYGGAEFNVISSLSLFGYKTKFLTKLPQNTFGIGAIRKLKSFNISTNLVKCDEGRIGMYFLEEGQGLRKSKVIYDRKESVFSKIQKEEIDFEKTLTGIDLIHISGVTPALSIELREIVLEILREAKKRNILVSYDSNYRAKLWSYSECGEFLKEALKYVDIAFLGALDCKNLLNLNIEAKDNKTELIQGYKKLSEMYPNIKYMASTKRTVISSNKNALIGYIFCEGKLEESTEYTFDVLDRVGGGDAFSAGILNGILRKFSIDTIVEFGTVASVLKHSYKGDINLANEEDILDLMENGNESIAR